jgi:hypothetical protein
MKSFNLISFSGNAQFNTQHSKSPRFAGYLCMLLSALMFSTKTIQAQDFYKHSKAADKWVNHTFKKMSKADRIAQLMIVRAHSNLGEEHLEAVTQLVQQYHVGGL